ncbi:MAG: response regulator transcription factor [Chloroflexi bacterium]|nr:response regulator transcription factor [Chloroflexota bacterium]
MTMTEKRIQVLLADDHAVMRAGLRLLIDNQADMHVVGEAGDGLQAIDQAAALQPDVILLDLTMPKIDGLTSLKQIRERAPRARVLILTMHADEQYLREALSRGASGYVVKQAADQEVLSAIRAVMRGELYIHPSLTKALLGDLVKEPGPIGPREPIELLSDRELHVIKQVARGYTNQEVAEKLSLSVKTVETYRARAMEKLGLTSRAALVRYAMEQGWLNE